MKINSLKQTTALIRGTTEPVLSAVLDMEDGTQEIISIPKDHKSWEDVQAGVRAYFSEEMTSEQLARLIKDSVNIIQKIADKFVRVHNILDGRMAIAGNKVTIDYEPIDGVLEAHIIRLLKSDGTPKDERNWKAFAKFIENLYGNTSDFVREQLFGWLNYQNLNGHGFTITDDGCFIGYKGCSGTPDAPLSVFSGYAIVDGQPMNGHVPNKVGSLIEMPRKQVTDDPAVGCAAGLHVGTYAYASNWSRGVLLTVKVNPRDVVSVPTECQAQKIRCSRYEVLEVTEVEYTEPTYGDYDDEDGYCPECDMDRDECDCENTCYECDEVNCHCDEDYCNYCDEYGHTEDDCPEDEDEDEDEESDSDFTVGDVISFRYATTYHGLRDYEITVNSVDNNLVNGVLTNGGGYRSFSVDKMQDVEITGGLESAKVSEPEPVKVAHKLNSGDDAPEAGDTVTITYTKMNGETKFYPNIEVVSVGVDFFRANTKDGVRSFTFDGVNSFQKVGTADKSDDKLDPEVETYVAIYGYGSDPWA